MSTDNCRSLDNLGSPGFSSKEHRKAEHAQGHQKQVDVGAFAYIVLQVSGALNALEDFQRRGRFTSNCSVRIAQFARIASWRTHCDSAPFHSAFRHVESSLYVVMVL